MHSSIRRLIDDMRDPISTPAQQTSMENAARVKASLPLNSEPASRYRLLYQYCPLSRLIRTHGQQVIIDRHMIKTRSRRIVQPDTSKDLLARLSNTLNTKLIIFSSHLTEGKATDIPDDVLGHHLTFFKDVSVRFHRVLPPPEPEVRRVVLVIYGITMRQVRTVASNPSLRTIAYCRPKCPSTATALLMDLAATD